MDIKETFDLIEKTIAQDTITIEQQIAAIDAINELLNAITGIPIDIEEPEEPEIVDAPDPADKSILDHEQYDGMSEAKSLELAQNGVKRDEDLVELEPAGIDALPINGVGKKTAQKWYDRAVELVGE